MMKVAEQQTRRISAGSLSLALHLVGFLILALMAQPPRDLPSTDVQRSVEIVLVRPDSAVRDRYLDQDATIAETTGRINPADSAPTAMVPGIAEAVESTPPQLALPVPDKNGAAAAIGLPQVTGSINSSGRIPIAGDVSGFIAAEQSRLRANRPVGDAVGVSLFGGTKAEGRSFIFVIDRSKSMGSEGLGALEAAEEELIKALRSLQPVHKFQIIAYHHQCVYLNRRELLPATDENKQLVPGFLSGLAAFGATEHEMALQSALIHKPDVIYLLTDGGDPELSDAQIRNLTKLSNQRTSIHCIQFGLGPLDAETSFLSRLAALNGGSFSYVDMSGRR